MSLTGTGAFLTMNPGREKAPVAPVIAGFAAAAGRGEGGGAAVGSIPAGSHPFPAPGSPAVCDGVDPGGTGVGSLLELPFEFLGNL